MEDKRYIANDNMMSSYVNNSGMNSNGDMTVNTPYLM